MRWIPGGALTSGVDETPSVVSKVLSTRSNPDTVFLDTVVVRIPEESASDLSGLWAATDETIFSLDTRQVLATNGLRAGTIIGEIPRPIRERLDAMADRRSEDVLEQSGLAADVNAKTQRLSCRAGRRKELIVRNVQSDSEAIVTLLNGVLTGASYVNPTFLFDLRTIPHGDGRATLTLIPEVQHGSHRQSYVSSEFGVRPELRRESHTWDALKIEAKLEPGQILAIAASDPSKSVGQAFFTATTAQQTHEQVLILLRLSATQLDDLFAPEIVAQAQSQAEKF